MIVALDSYPRAITIIVATGTGISVFNLAKIASCCYDKFASFDD